MNIKGFVRNNTNEDWRRVQFNFEFYGETWNTLDHYVDDNVTFIAHSLMNQDEQSFTTNYFHIHGKEESLRRISKYKITYKNVYYGKQVFIMVKPWKSQECFFEDQSIKILFSISETQVGISLHNKTNTPINIDWNNVSYVDIRGMAHGVVHTGVRYIERDRPQVPTIIPPAAMIEDVIVPSDHISYASGSGGGWSSRALFPDLQETDQYIGKSFSAFMPLEIDGTIKNYSCVFSIEREVL